MHGQVALAEEREQALMGQLAKGGTASWQRASAYVAAIRSAQDPVVRRDALNGLMAEVQRGMSEVSWKEIYAVWDLRRRLVDTQAKLMERLHKGFNPETSEQLIQTLQEVVRDEVKDPLPTAAILLQRIGERIRRSRLDGVTGGE